MRNHRRLVARCYSAMQQLDRGRLETIGSTIRIGKSCRRAPQWARPGLPGIAAGAVAALALALMLDAYQFAAQGSVAPLAVALMLWEIERHLD